jgi:hypothetical protein
MPLFVIADERNCCYAIDVAQEWMPEYELPEPFVAMSGAEFFLGGSGAVKVFNTGLPGGGIKWLHGLWRFHPDEAQGND